MSNSDLRAFIAPGGEPMDPDTWDFVEVSDRVVEPVTINRGRSSESDTAGPAWVTLTMRNDDGALSPHNPLGPWYGRLGLNTPLRVQWGEAERATTFISELPTTWPGVVEVSRAPVRSDGMLRRLGQGAQALDSALTRSFTRRSDVVAYWPAEDGRDARSVASPIRGVASFDLSDEVEAGAGEDVPAGSLPGLLRVQPGATNVMGRVPSHPSTSEYNAMLLFRQDEATAGFRNALQLTTSSATATNWRVRTSATETLIQVRDNDDVVVLSQTQTVNPLVHGRWVLVWIGLQQNGTALDWTYAILATDAEFTFLNGNTGTLSSTSMGRVTSVGAGSGVFASPERFFGHITLLRDPVGQLDLDAIHGYTGERAAHRLERLCDEERLQCQVVGDPDLTMPMGPQRADTLVAQFRDVEATDGGVLGDEDNLIYRTRTSRVNQDVAMDLGERDLIGTPQATDDDRHARNDVTASAPQGSSARVTDEESIRRLGRYADSLTVNPAGDSRLAQIASWNLHLGTTNELRWPDMSVSVLRNEAHLLDEWLALRVGDRMTAHNCFPQLPGIDIDVLVEGWTETLRTDNVRLDLNASPAKPWNVWQLEHGTESGEDEQFGRVWSPRPYLAEDIDATTTEFDVVVPVQRALNPASDFEQPFTVADRASSSFVIAVGDWAVDNVNRVSLDAVTEPRFRGMRVGRATALTAGFKDVFGYSPAVAMRHVSYRASAWVRTESTWDVQLALLFAHDFGSEAGGASQVLTVPPGVWTRLSVEQSGADAGAVASMNRVGLQIICSALPVGESLFIDDAEVGRAGAPFTTDPANFPQQITIGGETCSVTGIGADDGTGAQTWTVTRGGNGIVKPHSAGSRVDMYPGHVHAL